MNVIETKPVRISLLDGGYVSGLFQSPPKAKACYVFAHGAGAGMNHAFMAAAAEGLSERGIAALRYHFPYMEKGSKRPDSPKVAHASVRAAVAEASRLAPNLPLYAGGKSFGGRMTSHAFRQERWVALPRSGGEAPRGESVACE